MPTDVPQLMASALADAQKVRRDAIPVMHSHRILEPKKLVQSPPGPCPQYLPPQIRRRRSIPSVEFHCPLLPLASSLAPFVLTLCVLLTSANAQDWQKHSIDNRGRGADGVRLLDVNADGLFDIACGWEEAGETRAYLNPGPALVRTPWPSVTVGKSGPVEDAVFCDLDGDGAFDVISASEDQRIRVHWAPADASRWLDATSWTTEILPAATGLQNWMFTIPTQLDGHHGPDLVAAGKGPEVVWFEAPADPRNLAAWKRHLISSRGGWTMGMMLTELSGDDLPDLLLGIRRTNPGVRWFRNPGPGADLYLPWPETGVGVQGQAAGFVEVADLDGDGLTDVVVPMMEQRTLQIFRGLDRTGSRWQTTNLPLPTERNKGIAIGDINLDGQADLIVAHELGGAAWFSHSGNPHSTEWMRHPIGSGGKLDDVTLLDLDADGDLDVLTTDERGQQVIWFENPHQP